MKKHSLLVLSRLFALISLFFASNINAQNYSLSEGKDVGIGGGINHIELVDLNQDGKADQIVQNDLGQIWVSYSLFDGYFSTPQIIYTTDTYTYLSHLSIEIHDLNHDQLPDIVFEKYQNLYWLENKKDHFQTPQLLCADCVMEVAIFGIEKAWTLGDLNNDQELDVVTVKYNTTLDVTEFFCLYNVGNLVFDILVNIGLQPHGNCNINNIDNINIKDFNQDGIPEIFFIVYNQLYARQINPSTGTWQDMMYLLDVVSYNFVDYNNDNIDEITTLSSSGFLQIRNKEEQTIMFGHAYCPYFECSYTYTKIFTNDINGDEIPDITLLDQSNAITFQSLLSNGTNFDTYTKVVDINTNVIGMGDIDGDHDIDIINGYDGISYYKNDGEGKFEVFESNNADAMIPQNFRFWEYTDINNDQTKDIVILYGNGMDMSIKMMVKTLKSDGSMGRAYTKEWATGNDAMNYNLTDIDQDGDKDLLIVYYNEGIKLARNLGNMQFGEWEVLAFNCNACATIGVGDINGDQRPDIVVGGYWNIYVYTQTDAGGFSTTPQTIPHTAQYRQIDIIDLDQDGTQDVLLTYDTGAFAWLKSNGQTIEGSIRSITDYYCNMDDFIDLKSAHLGVNTLFVFISDNKIIATERQNGTFQSRILLENEIGIAQFVWIDANQDGKKDIVFRDFNSNIKISIAQTDGTYNTSKTLIDQQVVFLFPLAVDQQDAILLFSPLQGKLTWHRIITYDVPLQENIIATDAENLTDLCTADLNHDGWNDIVAVSKFSNSIAYYQNQQNDTFAEAQSTNTDLDDLQSLAPIDIDQDGDIDIATAADDDNIIAYYLNDGQGNLSSANIISQQVTGAKDLAAGDVDGDGKTDLVSVGNTGNLVYWHKNLGNGNFGNQLITDSLLRPTAVTITDMDKDGLTDIVIASETSNMLQIWEYKPTTATIMPIKNINVAQPQNFVMAELVRDFVEEILVASPQSGDVFYYIDNAIPNSDPIPIQSVFSTLANPKAVCVADLDQDGQQDVVSGSYVDGTIAWRRNAWKGSFNELHTIMTDALGIKVLTATDLDNDGDDDIVAASVLDGKIRWFKNKSQKPTPYTPPSQPNQPLATIYPNPTQDAVFINFVDDDLDSQYDCQLFNLSGQLINAQTLSNLPVTYWSLENLPAGLYLLRITHEDQSQVFRIVKW
ncbi:MAG: T9SS type A sorting domain-containing protein [Chitinophagales bacterium]|nr:T9SS type A sorting domain-containing protein [Chitinophagales bacterium]